MHIQCKIRPFTRPPPMHTCSLHILGLVLKKDDKPCAKRLISLSVLWLLSALSVDSYSAMRVMSNMAAGAISESQNGTMWGAPDRPALLQ